MHFALYFIEQLQIHVSELLTTIKKHFLPLKRPEE
jgi:hypothetical protein